MFLEPPIRRGDLQKTVGPATSKIPPVGPTTKGTSGSGGARWSQPRNQSPPSPPPPPFPSPPPSPPSSPLPPPPFLKTTPIAGSAAVKTSSFGSSQRQQPWHQTTNGSSSRSFGSSPPQFSCPWSPFPDPEAHSSRREPSQRQSDQRQDQPGWNRKPCLDERSETAVKQMARRSKSQAAIQGNNAPAPKLPAGRSDSMMCTPRCGHHNVEINGNKTIVIIRIILIKIIKIIIVIIVDRHHNPSRIVSCLLIASRGTYMWATHTPSHTHVRMRTDINTRRHTHAQTHK